MMLYYILITLIGLFLMIFGFRKSRVLMLVGIVLTLMGGFLMTAVLLITRSLV